MSENELRYADIAQVESVTFASYANEFLNLGWILLEVQGTQFTLGWPKSNGEIQKPPRRDRYGDLVTNTDLPF